MGLALYYSSPMYSSFAASDQSVYQSMSNQKVYLVFICFNICFLLQCSKFVVGSQWIVRSLPGFDGPLPFELETGYVGIGESDDVQLFYYFIKSERKPSEDPLVLWISGGPGCSSLGGLLNGIGPLYIKNLVKYDGSLPSLALNPNSWTKVSNIIFVDAPVNTGFSYSRSLQGSYTGDTESAHQTYNFLRKWLLNHPEFLLNPFYVGGDSYSGTTNPILVKNIADGNEAGQEPVINLKGYLLGSPVTDQHLSKNWRIPFSHGMGLISDELYESVKKNCKEEYVEVDPSNVQCVNDLQAFSECTSKISPSDILAPLCPDESPKPKQIIRRELHQKINLSDILESYEKDAFPSPKVMIRRSKSLFSPPPEYDVACREFVHALTYYWANNDRVQRAVNVRKGWKKEWVGCNVAGLNYTYDVKSSVAYHQILSKRNYRSLIYNGDQDFRVPFSSTQAWIKSLNYPVVDEWRPWFVDGQVAGYTRTYANNMTFATVKGGGHVATQTWPKQCFAMFTRWISLEAL